MSSTKDWSPARPSGPFCGEELASRCASLREHLDGRDKAAVGLATLLLSPEGKRLRSHDDPRRGHVTMVALSWEDDDHPDGGRVMLAELSAAEDLESLASIWSGASPPYLVFHRAQTSCSALRAGGIELPPRMGCLTTAATLLAAGEDGHRDDRKLDLLARQYLEVSLPSSPELGQQLAIEADILIPLMRELMGRVRAQDFTRVFQTEMRLLPAVIDMEAAGMPVDAAALEGVASSWVQEMGQDPPPDAKRRKRLEKLISTYRYWGRDFIDVDGRIRCRLNPLATDSGRFSCSEPNLQQVPSEHTAPGMRACFRPAPSHRFIVADYAQIELRVAAYLAPCAALRAVFVEGRDVHRTTAATLARKAPEEVTTRERQLAKAINFGFLFGMGAKRFRSYAQSSYGLELDQSQAESARRAFFDTFPGIQAWHRRIGQLSHQQRSPIEVKTVLGRKKRFPADAFSFNSALNIPVQGSAADGFKLAMIALHRELPALGGKGVLVVHDEFIAEVPVQNADQARVLVARVMEAEMARVVPGIPIVAEATIATSWAEK
jgi:DNA polymerase-1